VAPWTDKWASLGGASKISISVHCLLHDSVSITGCIASSGSMMLRNSSEAQCHEGAVS
jgi:hypothetical protein